MITARSVPEGRWILEDLVSNQNGVQTIKSRSLDSQSPVSHDVANSDDQAVQKANMTVKTGQKWEASRERSRGLLTTCRHHGHGYQGEAEPGSHHPSKLEGPRGVQKEMRVEEEEHRQARSVAMKQQGS